MKILNNIFSLQSASPNSVMADRGKKRGSEKYKNLNTLRKNGNFLVKYKMTLIIFKCFLMVKYVQIADTSFSYSIFKNDIQKQISQHLEQYLLY